MEKYKGINIPQEIIIVEKASEPNKWRGYEYKQAYVVNPCNKKMLENALNWARSSKYNWKTRQYEDIKEGTVYNYKNGHFKINLSFSAGGSSQGGRLSFWDCTVDAPDGKHFIIGINQDTLISLLRNTTIINGEIQEEVWLGRDNSRVCAYTSNMEEFKQAMKDEESRDKAKKTTTKYEKGTVVETLTLKEIYLGEIYKQFEVVFPYDDRWSYNSRYYDHPIEINIYSQPKPLHCYIKYNEKGDYSYVNPNYYYWLDSKAIIKKEKSKRLISDTKANFTLEELIAEVNQKAVDRPFMSFYENESGDEFKHYISRAKLDSLQYTVEDISNKEYISKNIDLIKKLIIESHYLRYDVTFKINYLD